MLETTVHACAGDGRGQDRSCRRNTLCGSEQGQARVAVASGKLRVIASVERRYSSLSLLLPESSALELMLKCQEGEARGQLCFDRAKVTRAWPC